MNIFLSFSGEGRKQFGMKFLEFFNKHGLKCWYDQHELYLGDILSDSIIENGLNKTEYAILIINNTFLSRDWPCKEAKILFDRATTDKNVILFPLLWNVTKEQVIKSDISYILNFKYQFVDDETPLEIISYQIMNRIFHDILINKFNSCTINDVRNNAQNLTLPKCLEVYNCLKILSQISPLNYEVQATILIITIKLLNQNNYVKLVETLSYRLYNQKLINFDICKILEAILIIDYFTYVN